MAGEHDEAILEALVRIGEIQDQHTVLLNNIVAILSAPPPDSDLDTLLRHMVLTLKQVMQALGVMIRKQTEFATDQGKLITLVIQMSNKEPSS